MSFSGRTPESLLPRSDSKNPATTCRGITTSGRPCRRGLPSASANQQCCWQHKDQFEHGVVPQKHEPGRSKQSIAEQQSSLRQRSSLDTLIDRVGSINLDDHHHGADDSTSLPEHLRRPLLNPSSKTSRNTRPTLQHNQALLSVPEAGEEPTSTTTTTTTHAIRQSQRPSKTADLDGRRRQRQRPRSNVAFSWSCCIRADYDDDGDGDGLYNSKPSMRPTPTHRSRHKPPTSRHHATSVHQESLSPPQTSASAGIVAARATPPTSTLKSKSASTSASDSVTQALLALIPKSLTPRITSAILAELSRPISRHDEDGYIYIFWLTPESDTLPDDETASTLLDGDNDQNRTRSREAAIQRYASVHNKAGRSSLQTPRTQHQGVQSLDLSTSTPPPPPPPQQQPRRTLMLKIGRAQNVHRRMSQWTKQCGQNITLIRYYPHQPSSSLSSANVRTSTGPATGTGTPLKAPCVARVERLIHLELAEKRALRGKCEHCGREHREWFEVEATRAGLRDVDEVVRRWVRWAMDQDQDMSNRGGTNTSPITTTTTAEAPATRDLTHAVDVRVGDEVAAAKGGRMTDGTVLVLRRDDSDAWREHWHRGVGAAGGGSAGAGAGAGPDAAVTGAKNFPLNGGVVNAHGTGRGNDRGGYF